MDFVFLKNGFGRVCPNLATWTEHLILISWASKQIPSSI